MAGFETTSNTLSTLCYNLARHPDILDTLIEEVDEVFDKFGGVVNHETISEMPYLDACIKGIKGNISQSEYYKFCLFRKSEAEWTHCPD